jgi:hypothetical protein
MRKHGHDMLRHSKKRIQDTSAGFYVGFNAVACFHENHGSMQYKWIFTPQHGTFTLSAWM